jgi:hypothetical protein
MLWQLKVEASEVLIAWNEVIQPIVIAGIHYETEKKKLLSVRLHVIVFIMHLLSQCCSASFFNMKKNERIIRGWQVLNCR